MEWAFQQPLSDTSYSSQSLASSTYTKTNPNAHNHPNGETQNKWKRNGDRNSRQTPLAVKKGAITKTSRKEQENVAKVFLAVYQEGFAVTDILEMLDHGRATQIAILSTSSSSSSSSSPSLSDSGGGSLSSSSPSAVQGLYGTPGTMNVDDGSPSHADQDLQDDPMPLVVQDDNEAIFEDDMQFLEIEEVLELFDYQ